MAEQMIQSTPLVQQLAFCQENKDFLNEWEQERASEWLNRVQNGGFISEKCQSIISRMVDDINQGKKPLSSELQEMIQLALAGARYLHTPEVQFIEGLADFKEGQIKLSKNQRAWLHKIENRLHKQGFR